MSTLILYISKHGCAKKSAKKLSELIKDKTEIIDIRKNFPKSIQDFDTIIIGGSIHAGMIQKKVKKLCKQFSCELINKKLGLFLCCMEEGEKANEQFENAYPENLQKHATATGLFGGEFTFEKMNFLEKSIVKKISKISESVSKINEKAINEFAINIKN